MQNTIENSEKYPRFKYFKIFIECFLKYVNAELPYRNTEPR